MRPRRLALALAAAAVMHGASGCFFSLADVVADGGAADASKSDASAAGDGAIDPSSFTQLGPACAGAAVRGLAISGSQIYAACAPSGGAALGAIVVAPLGGGAFAAAPGSGQGEALSASGGGDVYFHGACGIERISGGVGSVLSQVPPASVSATAALGGTFLFAGGSGSNALWKLASPTTCNAPGNGCASGTGCSSQIGQTSGPSMGLATYNFDTYDYVCESGHPALYSYQQGGWGGGGGSTSVFSSAGSSCGAVRLGLASSGQALFFGVDNKVKRLSGSFNKRVDDAATEQAPVTLVTSDGMSIYWVSGTVVRRMGGPSPSTVGDVGTPVTALAVAGGVAYVGTETGLVARSK